MSYCAPTDIARQLQRALTAGESAQAQAVCDAASAYIDRTTGRGGFGPATVTGELHRIDGPLVYLRRRPVDSVQSVSIRPLVAGTTSSVLTALKSYELLDGPTGKLSIAVWWDATEDRIPAVWAGWQLTANYTVVAAVPPDIVLAAELIAASWLTAPELSKYQTLRLDGIDYTLAADVGLPPVAAKLLSGRRKVVFA